MKKKSVLFWLPRILAILFILFLSLFALDVFLPDTPILTILVGLFMHLIPNFILIGMLVVAWKYERIGGILFLLSAIPFFFTRQPMVMFGFSGVLILIGILFLASSSKKRSK